MVGSPGSILVLAMWLRIMWKYANMRLYPYYAHDPHDERKKINDLPGDDGTLRSVKLLVFLLGVIDLASASA